MLPENIKWLLHRPRLVVGKGVAPCLGVYQRGDPIISECESQTRRRVNKGRRVGFLVQAQKREILPATRSLSSNPVL